MKINHDKPYRSGDRLSVGIDRNKTLCGVQRIQSRPCINVFFNIFTQFTTDWTGKGIYCLANTSLIMQRQALSTYTNLMWRMVKRKKNYLQIYKVKNPYV